MKVILPDGSELELPDGATGLDAARAIGPKLAEQAVLVRLDGVAQDLRLPLPDGAAIQILTTRDRHDPGRPRVLRHSAAHLLAEAARRLYPGTKVAIGPPIENGFYYDFEFPEPIGEEALERLEEEIRREIAEGRAFERSEVDRDEARRIFEAEGEPYKVELVDTADGPISFYRQGDFTDLCRGPHLPERGADQGGEAPLARRRLLARRRDEAAADPRLRHRVLRPEGPRRAPPPARGGEGAATTAASGASSTSFDFSELAAGMPFWHPKGMVVWNVLEDLRRRENARRGYHEIRTPQLYDAELWKTSGHWEKFRDDMFTPRDRGSATSGSSR